MGDSLEVDATNSCIPPSSPLLSIWPPQPSTVRGEPCVMDAKTGRLNGDRPLLMYGNGRCVVVRDLSGNDNESGKETIVSSSKAFVYRGHTSRVTCAKFSPSGAYVASADERGKLRVWSYDNEEHYCKLDFRAMAGPIHGVAWDGESKRIGIVGHVSSSAGSNGKDSNCCARVFYWDTGVSCGELGKHVRNRANCCDGRQKRPWRIVTGGGEDHLLSLNKGAPFEFLKKGDAEAHIRGAIHCLRYSPDGATVASVGADRTVCFWDGLTLDLLGRRPQAHGGTIYACDWTVDGTAVVTCGADGRVMLLQAPTGDILKTWDLIGEDDRIGGKAPYGAMQLGCAVLKDGRALSVGVNGTITCMSMSGGDNINDDTVLLEGHQCPIVAMSYRPESNTLYTADSDGKIFRRNATTGLVTRIRSRVLPDPNRVGKVHRGTITGLLHVPSAPDGSCRLLSCGWDDVLRLSDDDESHKELPLHSQPNAMAIGTSLVAIVLVQGIALYRDDGQVLATHVEVKGYAPLSVAVSPDDSIVCVGGDDRGIHVYRAVTVNLPNGETKTNLEEDTSSAALANGGVILHHKQPVHSLAFSPNGQHLASADVRDICVWDAAGWTPVISKSRWCFHAQKITSLAWSPDGTFLASASMDDTIFVWCKTQKTKRLCYSFCHRGGVTGLAWKKGSAGKEYVLISAGNDGCICQWNIGTDLKAKFGIVQGS